MSKDRDVLAMSGKYVRRKMMPLMGYGALSVDDGRAAGYNPYDHMPPTPNDEVSANPTIEMRVYAAAVN